MAASETGWPSGECYCSKFLARIRLECVTSTTCMPTVLTAPFADAEG